MKYIFLGLLLLVLLLWFFRRASSPMKKTKKAYSKKKTKVHVYLCHDCRQYHEVEGGVKRPSIKCPSCGRMIVREETYVR